MRYETSTDDSNRQKFRGSAILSNRCFPGRLDNFNFQVTPLLKISLTTRKKGTVSYNVRCEAKHDSSLALDCSSFTASVLTNSIFSNVFDLTKGMDVSSVFLFFLFADPTICWHLWIFFPNISWHLMFFTIFCFLSK